jgi:hypothetical protein
MIASQLPCVRQFLLVRMAPFHTLRNCMSKSSWHIIGYILYGIAVLDFAGMFLGYDFTGVDWSPLAFGALGYCCFHYTKEPTLAEGEELLVLGDGKQANVTVTINKDLKGKGINSQDASHKVFLTNETLQIDGDKVSVIWPYSTIQSVSKDTYLKMDMALRLVTHDNQDVKLAFGMGRAKKRDLFMAAIQAKSSEASGRRQ